VRIRRINHLRDYEYAPQLQLKKEAGQRTRMPNNVSQDSNLQILAQTDYAAGALASPLTALLITLRIENLRSRRFSVIKKQFFEAQPAELRNISKSSQCLQALKRAPYSATVDEEPLCRFSLAILGNDRSIMNISCYVSSYQTVC